MVSLCRLCVVAVFCLLLSSCVLPQEQDIYSENPFDAGPISDCQLPETTYCAEYVDYRVPSSIAWLAPIKESKISNTIEPTEDGFEDLGDMQCNLEILKETWCRREFPRCSNNNVVLFQSPENCVERLMSSNCGPRADSIIRRGFCKSSQSTLHSGSCRSLSEHNQDEYLQQCSVLGENMQVSDWMFHYISRVDVELRNGGLLRETTECWELYRIFLCGTVGECVGDRVYMINTKEMCQAILNCYPDDVAMAITNILTCESWPLQRKDPPLNSTTPPLIWLKPPDRKIVFTSSVVPLKATLYVTCPALLISILSCVIHLTYR